MKIEEIKHLDVDGKIIWKDSNLKNILHLEGELYLLEVVFNTASATVPTNYYLGLDNRSTLSLSDSLSSLSGEPTQNGYTRQAVSSLNGFSVALDSGTNSYRATSNIVTFTASGGSWGPIVNLFLTTTSTNSGYLMSSVALSGSRTVLDGQSLTMRFSLGLINT